MQTSLQLFLHFTALELYLQFTFVYNIFQNGIVGGVNVRLDRLKYFLTVAEIGNFSGAAEKMYTTQSAVSKQVIALEKEVGATLFDRSHRKVVLTEQGEIVYTYANEVIKQCDAMFAALEEHRNSTGGALSIASIPVMRQYGITDLVGNFRKKCPNVTMSVGELEGSEILNALERGKYDMAFMRIEQLPAGGYEYIPLSQDILMALLPGNHPLSGEDKISLAQLEREPFLLLNEGTLLHRMCLDACRRCGFVPSVTYTGTRNENIAELVAMGMGVSLVMEQFYLRVQPQGVCCVPLKEHVTSTIALVRPKGIVLSGAAELFWESVRNSVEKEGTIHS